MKRSILTPLTSMLVLVMLITGCTLRKPVANHAVAYNRAVERSQNEVLLLNIVRSMKRHPQHYTAITQVRGTATNELSPSLNLTLKNGEGASSTSGLGASFSRGTSLVDVAVLDDQKFTNGVLNPVGLEQVEYFREQGWSKSFLGLLLIEKIEISDEVPDSIASCAERNSKDPKTTVYLNDPDESHTQDPFHRVKCFRDRLLEMHREGLGIGIKTEEVSVELPRFNSPRRLEAILEAHETGWRVAGGSLVKKEKIRVIEWKAGAAVSNDPEGRQEFNRARKEGKTIAKFHFRSPEGILYYLGEVMRAQAVVLSTKPACPRSEALKELEPGLDATGGSTRSGALLFVALEKQCPEDKDSLVSVEHRGTKYVIPSLPSCKEGQVVDKEGCHRSMQVLAIVKQLIGLNKSRESLPTTGVVTATGG